MHLFEYGKESPLSERLRPRTLDEFFGQKHILGEGKLLSSLLKEKRVPSLILWGPPGCGKTTLARLIAGEMKLPSFFLSAVTITLKDVKEILKRARSHKLLLFLDEFHRFNRLRQETFLPYVENGDIILIGATTENPSFEIVGPLLSRMRVLKLEPLSEDELLKVLQRAKNDPEIKELGIECDEECLRMIARVSSGDARRAINIFEQAHLLARQRKLTKIEPQILEEVILGRVPLHDRKGDMHYGLISAFIKSMRGSDPDAAIYWLMRMLKAGEDPLFILRRMVIFASEDIGCADPYALVVALAAKDAFMYLGAPEGYLPLIHACIYLSLCEKSNSVYRAMVEVEKDVESLPEYPPPKHLLMAPTKLMRDMGYGEGYLYPHDFEDGISPQSYMPEEISDRAYYFPKERGLEKRLKRYLERARRIRKGTQNGDIGG